MLALVNHSGLAVDTSIEELFFLSGFHEDGVGFHGCIRSGTADAVGQCRMDPIQRQAGLHAFGKSVTVDTLSTRALHQIPNIKIEAVSVVIGHVGLWIVR